MLNNEVEAGLPLNVLLEFHVSVPAVKFIVPLFTRLPVIVKPTAPESVELLFTVKLKKVRIAPEATVVPLNTTVPPLAAKAPDPPRFPEIFRLPEGAVKEPVILTALNWGVNDPPLVNTVVPLNVAVPDVKLIDPLAPIVTFPAILVAVAEACDKAPFTFKAAKLAAEEMVLFAPFKVVENVEAV
jgi:hypothetical protein